MLVVVQADPEFRLVLLSGDGQQCFAGEPIINIDGAAHVLLCEMGWA